MGERTCSVAVLTLWTLSISDLTLLHHGEQRIRPFIAGMGARVRKLGTGASDLIWHVSGRHLERAGAATRRWD